MKQLLQKKWFKYVANKYFITAVAFLAWSLFFDQNDIMSLQERQEELNTVKGNIAYLNAEIEKMKIEKDALLTDPKVIEAYAREYYHMKHDNEDVYIIDTTAPKKPIATKEK